MERVNYIKPNIIGKVEARNAVTNPCQEKVYQKIELIKESKPTKVVCDINKNLRNGDVSRRGSSGSSGRCSVASNQQTDESMIMMRKKYKEVEKGLETQDQPQKTYKKKIFEIDTAKQPEPSENREEFYKYLGIDTKPPVKRVYRPEITNLDIFKRRSLRVRYLKIQSQTQSQCQETQSEVIESGSKDAAEKRVNLSPPVPSKEVTRPHDVKVLRSYLKPKQKKAENDWNHDEKRTLSPVIPLKPVKKVIRVEKVPQTTVKYLMRSKINLSETRLRSGLQKNRLLRPSRYLSRFNKRPLLRRPVRSQNEVKTTKENKKTPKPIEQSTAKVQTEIKEETELPKSPVPQVPDSTVNFQSPTIHQSSAMPAQVSTSTIDTLTSSAHTLKNPLNRDDGKVLFAYVNAETLVIAQEKSVSFWRYSPFKHLVGMDQTWELIGRTKRHNYDIEIDCCKSDRICFNENSPIYIELRVTRAKDNENRQCPLSSVYVVVYSINSKQEFPGWTCGPVINNFVQLDSVQSSAHDIHFIALPGTRYFIISWYQHLIQSKSSGLCKYSLTPDLRTLASIREFPHAKHIITDLKCLEETKLIGLGNTELSMWNHTTGDLLMSIDFNLQLGRNISIFEFKNQVIHCMFLTQVVDSCTQSNYKSIKVLGINLSDDSWKVLKTHELPLNLTKCSKLSTADTSNIAFCSIDHGQSLLMMSKNDLQWIKLIQTNHRTSDMDSSSLQLFFNGSKVVEIGENILIKSLDEFCLQM